MSVSQLHDDVTHVANSQGRSRQYLASYLASLDGTRMGGFVLTRQVPVGKWGKTIYALKMTAEEAEHRGHRGHRDASQAHEQANGAADHVSEECNVPMTPMTPMPSAAIG